MSDILKIAVLAVGGQGGGVLSNWIKDLAEANGYVAQMTSVAGVAQRTGATIYYIEMAPEGPRQPVFALSPSPGDVDVLIAAEIMEAGRAAQRGFITPDRTVLIASTHRILAVAEKQVPGDGRGAGADVLAELQSHAAQVVAFDMEAISQSAGSMISAGLFGGLARARVLPFAPDQFRAVVARAKKGAKTSLAAFDAALGFEAPAATDTGPAPPVSSHPGLTALLEQIEALPGSGKAMLEAGLRQVVDFQDLAYGKEYLDRVAPFLGHHSALDEAAAKAIAQALCYDDLPRVADLKTRETRVSRLRAEQEIPEDGLVRVTEYFHPRVEEVLATLPRGMSHWFAQRPWALGLLRSVFSRGRRIRSDRMRGYLLLWAVAGLRKWRRVLQRHSVEMAHLDALCARAAACLPDSPVLAAELFACQRLIKGYSDTHARGQSKFDKVMHGADKVSGRADAADWVRRLRVAALQDVEGTALDAALETIASFAPEKPVV